MVQHGSGRPKKFCDAKCRNKAPRYKEIRARAYRKYFESEHGRAAHDRAHRKWYYEGGGREHNSIKALDERIQRYTEELAEMGPGPTLQDPSNG